MLARCISYRGPHGSVGLQGVLRRGACGAVLLGKVCYGRVWCTGEGMQGGHTLMSHSAWCVVRRAQKRNRRPFKHPPVKEAHKKRVAFWVLRWQLLA